MISAMAVRLNLCFAVSCYHDLIFFRFFFSLCFIHVLFVYCLILFLYVLSLYIFGTATSILFDLYVFCCFCLFTVTISLFYLLVTSLSMGRCVLFVYFFCFLHSPFFAGCGFTASVVLCLCFLCCHQSNQCFLVYPGLPSYPAHSPHSLCDRSW